MTRRCKEQTSGYQWGGGAVQGWEWEVQTIGYKMGSWKYVQHGEQSQYFVITVNGR